MQIEDGSYRGKMDLSGEPFYVHKIWINVGPSRFGLPTVAGVTIFGVSLNGRDKIATKVTTKGVVVSTSRTSIVSVSTGLGGGCW